MQPRRLLNDNPGLTTAISIGLLLVALVIVGYYLWPRPVAPVAPPTTQETEDNIHAAACPAAAEPVQVAVH